MKPQIATTREQSERLLECGVTDDTADMCLSTRTRKCDGTFIAKKHQTTNLWVGYPCWRTTSGDEELENIPAWSLSALLGLIPDIITYGGYEWGLFMTKLSRDTVCISYARWDNFNSTIGHLSGDSIEACVQIIEWLHANGHKFNYVKDKEK